MPPSLLSSAFNKMGESSLALFAESGICQNLKKLPKMSNFFDSFFNDFLPGNIEKNYQWSIYREGSSFIEVQGSVNGEVTACLGENNVITPSLENLRKGFLKSVPKLYADYSVDINMLKRLSAGDSYDLYRIEFFRVNKIPAFLH